VVLSDVPESVEGVSVSVPSLPLESDAGSAVLPPDEPLEAPPEEEPEDSDDEKSVEERPAESPPEESEEE
jgi:hypothetical protein